MTDQPTALIISAHAADFVWRCGGAIALHAQMGIRVTVACLSFGERGESAKLWKEGKTLDEVKSIRRAEAEAALPEHAFKRCPGRTRRPDVREWGGRRRRGQPGSVWIAPSATRRRRRACR